MHIFAPPVTSVINERLFFQVDIDQTLLKECYVTKSTFRTSPIK